jgi:hypothetical protein
MFKIVPCANANPAKREPFTGMIQTRGKIHGEGTLYHGANDLGYSFY